MGRDSCALTSRQSQQIRPTPVKTCQMCGAQFERGRLSTGEIDDRAGFMKRKYCSRSCANRVSKGGTSRGNSNELARRHLKQFCDSCCSSKKLQIHHIDEDWLNNSPSNLQTLCEFCHRSWHASQRCRGIKPAGKMPARPSSILICEGA
jgi:hypothetical protein